MTLEELYDLLLVKKPSSYLKNNEKELFDLIPEIKICKGFDQKNEWHIYDVYEHILHVVDSVPPTLVMRLTALFHDIGKPLTYTEDENGVGHFYGHWEASQRIFDAFAKKCGINEDIRKRVSDLIYYHDINVSRLSESELEEMTRRLGKDGISQLFDLKRADLLAQNEKYHYLLEDYYKQKSKLLFKFQKADEVIEKE
ncbi:MAG: HD domain-containing protein [Clostridia bacterium]|nr:HD domain-containing protein [Clostridia bacterium]